MPRRGPGAMLAVMPAYCLVIETAPLGGVFEPGSIVGCFENRGDAEAFRLAALRMASLRGHSLAVAEFPASGSTPTVAGKRAAVA